MSNTSLENCSGVSFAQILQGLRGVFTVILALMVISVSDRCCAQEAHRPKYAADVVRLYRDHSYLQKHEAPDYWALSPYYMSQENDASCSVAAVAMIVNAIRARDDLPADDQLVTHSVLLEKVKNHRWQQQVGEGGAGVTLAELEVIAQDTLLAYNLKNSAVEIVSFPAATKERLLLLRQLLAENERSDRDLIVVNVVQGLLTGDPAGMVGHFMPIAAYDAASRRVLLLDPDRNWYEPYWVPDEKLLAAMATIDAVSRKPRGLMRVKMK